MTKITPPCHPDKVQGLTDTVYIRQATAYAKHHGIETLIQFERKRLIPYIRSVLANRLAAHTKPNETRSNDHTLRKYLNDQSPRTFFNNQ